MEIIIITIIDHNNGQKNTLQNSRKKNKTQKYPTSDLN